MSGSDYRGFWDVIVNELKNEIGEEEIAMWFSRIVYERSSDTVIFFIGTNCILPRSGAGKVPNAHRKKAFRIAWLSYSY